jgi:hypothetical protein
MNEEQDLQSEEINISEPSPQPEDELSVPEAITGVITEPSETYERMSSSSRKNYWLIPLMILIAANLIGTYIFFSNDELISKVVDKEIAKLDEKLDKGELSESDYDMAKKFVDPKGTFFLVIGYGGSLVGPFFILIILSVLYFVILKIFKLNQEFSRVMNIVGLAMIIMAVGNLVSILVSVVTGTMSGVSPALLMTEPEGGDIVYSLVSKLDIFTIWFLFIIAIGLNKAAKLEAEKAYSAVFGIWLVYVIFTSVI